MTGASRTPADLVLTVVAGVLVLMFAITTWNLRFAGVATVLGWTMLAIAAIDRRTFRIPDVLSLPAIPAGLLVTFLAISRDAALDHATAIVIAAGSLWLVRTGYAALRGRDGLGLGDVKLAAVAGAWTGTDGIASVLLLASCAALLVVGYLVVSGKSVSATMKLPFGTFLAPAIWLVFAHQNLGLV
jgi:leader peptidase (prepilin peptidase) / N-methyltransferase